MDWIDLGINAALWMTIGGAVLALAMSLIFGLMSNPKQLVTMLVGLAVLAIFFFVIYSMSSGAATGIFQTDTYSWVTEGTLKMVSAGITASLVMLAAGFVILIVMELVNLVK